MMWKNIFVAALLVGIICLSGSLLYVNGDKMDLEKENAKLEKVVSQQKKDVAALEVNQMQQGVNTAAEIDFVKGFFSIYQNYTTDTYRTRFDELAGYTTDDVLTKLQGASALEPPILPMKNELVKQQVFYDPSEPHTFLIYTSTAYSLDGNVIANNNILYEVTVLSEDGGKYKITNVVVKGNLEEVSGV